jgi:hypothetical protein
VTDAAAVCQARADFLGSLDHVRSVVASALGELSSVSMEPVSNRFPSCTRVTGPVDQVMVIVGVLAGESWLVSWSMGGA